MELGRRAATPADVPFLLALRRETMDAYLAASGMDTSDEAHLTRLMYAFEHAQVLTRGNEPVGLLKLRRSAEAWEIVQLQLASALQGQGLGRSLLQEILADAAAAQAAVKLSVLKTNPARHLYERLGFKVIAEDEHEYHMRHAG